MPEVDVLYDPELYAMMHRGTAGDLAYYVDALDGAGSVLEIGCGYGRVLEVLANTYPHLHLEGIDIHDGLLTMARKAVPSRVNLHLCDMTKFQLSAHFDVVIAAYSTLWCLANDDQIRRCFERVLAHLNEGGKFLFDAYAADKFHQPSDLENNEAEAQEECYSVAEIYSEKSAYHVAETSVWHPSRQAFEVYYDHQPIAPYQHLPPVLATIEHRYLLADQLITLLNDSGFSYVNLWDGFEGRPWTSDACHLVGEAG
ncbi:MAG: class I SAM-dependent methyltransferase [Myxococcales bacterium]|nr:class I SAM-dependent methyltransferase [Myxococcales bacterium]